MEVTIDEIKEAVKKMSDLDLIDEFNRDNGFCLAIEELLTDAAESGLEPGPNRGYVLLEMSNKLYTTEACANELYERLKAAKGVPATQVKEQEAA